jgi:hypothetical protein
VDLDRIRRQVYEPRLGDTGSGVQRQLPAPVVNQQGIGDLDYKQRLLRNGRTRATSAPAHKREVRRLSKN